MQESIDWGDYKLPEIKSNNYVAEGKYNAVINNTVYKPEHGLIQLNATAEASGKDIPDAAVWFPKERNTPEQRGRTLDIFASILEMTVQEFLNANMSPEVIADRMIGGKFRAVVERSPNSRYMRTKYVNRYWPGKEDEFAAPAAVDSSAADAASDAVPPWKK